jgi:hypothetical protein
MLGFVLPSYLTMLFGVRKCFENHVACTLLPNAFVPGPLGLRLHPSWRGFHARCSDWTSSPPPPPTGLIARLGFWAWAEIRAGEEVIPATGGSMAAFYRLALERPELEIETPARRWRELSACYVFLGVELIQCQSNHDIYACS